MKPSELLREVRRRLRRDNWKVGARDGERMCVVDRLAETAPLDTWRGETALRALRVAANQSGWATPQGLNDHGPTRLWGVVAMLGRAIRRLETEGR